MEPLMNSNTALETDVTTTCNSTLEAVSTTDLTATLLTTSVETTATADYL